MPRVVVPYTFQDNVSFVDAITTNANNAALAAAANNVDATQLVPGAALANIGAAAITGSYLAPGAALANIGAGGVTSGYLARADQLTQIRRYSIEDFGADPTGAALSDTAFANAIAAIVASPSGKGCIVAGAGNYKISAAVALPSGVRFEGAGIGITTITQTTLTVPIFSGTSANFIGVARCNLTYASASTTGKALSFTTCTFVFLDDLSISNYGTAAVWHYNTSNVRATNVDGIGTASSTDGYYINATDAIGFNSNDHHITNCRFGGPSNSTTIGGESFHISGGAAIWLTSCDSFNAHDNLLIDPPAGQLVSNLFISNSSFDFATNNSVTVKPTGGSAILLSFSNCWASGGNSGLVLDSSNGAIDQVQITNLRANNCNSYGIVVQATSGTGPTNVSIVNPMTVANHVGGIGVNTCSQLTIVGGFSGNSPSYSNPPYTNQQQYGFLFAGTNNNITLIGVTFLSTNTTAIFAPGSSMAGVIIRSCPGINNPVGALTTTQATGVATLVSGTFYTNHSGYDYTMYVKPGAISSITVNGVATGFTSATSSTYLGVFDVPVGASFAITFTVAPTVTFAAK